MVYGGQPELRGDDNSRLKFTITGHEHSRRQLGIHDHSIGVNLIRRNPSSPNSTHMFKPIGSSRPLGVRSLKLCLSLMHTNTQQLTISSEDKSWYTSLERIDTAGGKSLLCVLRPVAPTSAREFEFLGACANMSKFAAPTIPAIRFLASLLSRDTKHRLQDPCKFRIRVTRPCKFHEACGAARS